MVWANFSDFFVGGTTSLLHHGLNYVQSDTEMLTTIAATGLGLKKTTGCPHISIMSKGVFKKVTGTFITLI